MTTRARDPLYDVWVETWGTPATATERGRLNRALKELREIDATPAQLRHVLRMYDHEFSGCTRSPQGVTGNWTLLLSMRGAARIDARRETQCAHGVSYFARCQQCIDA